MRVSEASGARGETASATKGRPFGEAMRRARAAGAAAARAASAGEAAARTAGSRRAAADAKEAGLGARRGGFCEEERAAAPAPLPSPAPPPQPGTAAPGAGAAELRSVVRALPVAVDAWRVRDGAPLSLSLGRALDVDLRSGPSGVELVLRPEARLARAAEAELPALLASLRARGIAVARAEVRARGGPRGEGGAR